MPTSRSHRTRSPRPSARSATLRASAWGAAAHAYGAGPLGTLAGALVRARARPLGACGVHYVAGWALAALRRSPRAEPEARAFFRAEQRRRLLAAVRRARP